MRWRRRVEFALLALAIGAVQAQASTLWIIRGITATSSQIQGWQKPYQGQPPAPMGNQAFSVVVSGTGAVACTVQFWAANLDDLSDAVSYGATVAASGTTTAAASANGGIPYAWFGAQVTAISGTGASCAALLNT